LGNGQQIRVLICKPGLDGHDRGAKVVAQALRDAGMEVIYTGLHQTPEQIAMTAIQEDVNVIGLSILSGAHLTLVKKLINIMKKKDISEIPLVLGGVIPDKDIPKLKKMGVNEIFLAGAKLSDICKIIVNCAQKMQGGAKN
jgi:methylmalonyl-CoA mutase, C-terminal domain